MVRLLVADVNMRPFTYLSIIMKSLASTDVKYHVCRVKVEVFVVYIVIFSVGMMQVLRSIKKIRFKILKCAVYLFRHILQHC